VAQADVDAFKYKMGQFSDKDDEDLQKISEAMGVLAEAEIFIDETPGISIYDIRTRARKLKFEQNIDVLLVDYLQLAHGQHRDNRVQEVSEISQGCKNIARELKIPVIALSQLSREIEKRQEKVPQLSDLRESGSIEQDADVVMFLYYEDKDFRENVKLKIAKHRNGALGTVDLYFKGDRISFFGIDKKIMED
jgi:replicative DNA helicase